MAPTQHTTRATAVDRVRHELLTALHFGKLTPGDRAPSVRGLARRTGMNRKTVHRAYVHLAEEGLVDLRPGSGTFISQGLTSSSDTRVNELLAAANRCSAKAGALGIRPDVLAVFLGIYLGNGLRGVPVMVTECNHEQLGLIRDELQSRLGVSARAALLPELLSRTNGSLDGCHGIVTTDCHFSEVAESAIALRLPVYRVALDASFPQRLAAEAFTSRILMVVRDRSFGPVFLGLLERLPVMPECLEQIRILDVAEARRVLREPLGERTKLCISPLVESQVADVVPPGVERLQIRWHVESKSMEYLKASLALDLARRQHEASEVAVSGAG